MSNPVRICVVGSGYVGLVAAVCFAEIGHKVTCVDSDESKINLLNSGGIPIYEEHLKALLQKHLNAGVRFTTQLETAVETSEAIFIAVGTPQDSSGAADLSYVEAVVSQIARCLNGYKVLIEKSTVPVYTNEWISECMHRYGVPPHTFDVVSNPEFLREGTAVTDFLHPDRIVIGANSERSGQLLRRIYEPLTSGKYYSHKDAVGGGRDATNPAKVLVTSAQSAELIKHASNAFLAMKISFMNTVANLAEVVNADIEDIAVGMGLDSRIGTKFLRAGLGYGGSCFPKDIAAFRWVAQQQGISFQILEEVSKINTNQREVFFNKIRYALWTLRGKRIAALGLAFKGGTDDIRESPGIEIIRKLMECGCIVSAYDPAAMERTEAVLPSSDHMIYARNEYDAAKDADALLILTDWPEFACLDLHRLSLLMRFPIIIDGRNLYELSHMREQGFTYVSIGRPAVRSGMTTVQMKEETSGDAPDANVAGLGSSIRAASVHWKL